MTKPDLLHREETYTLKLGDIYFIAVKVATMVHNDATIGEIKKEFLRHVEELSV